MIPDFSQTEKAPEGFYDKVGIMLMPGNGMEMVPTPGDMVGATEPEKIEAAVAFLKFETSPENQIKALEMTGLQPVSDNLEIPESLTESDPLMAQVLDIQGKAEVTYGQNQAYWYQNTIDTFSTQLPELAYGNITAEEFCTKLSESAAKIRNRQSLGGEKGFAGNLPASPFCRKGELYEGKESRIMDRGVYNPLYDSVCVGLMQRRS